MLDHLALSLLLRNLFTAEPSVAMPIFTRRRLQAMLDDLAPLLGPEKRRDVLRRIENKRVEQALPGEMELGLLWALSQLGEIEVEPEWWSTRRKPDVYCPFLNGPDGSIIEIAAFSDGSISQDDDMRRIAARFVNEANRLKKGSGQYLHFHFGEESGYVNGTYLRRRTLKRSFCITERVQSALKVWLDTDFSVESGKALLISDQGTTVQITRTATPQNSQFNFFCTMPALAHSLEGNALFALLDEKSGQLRGAGEIDDPYARLIFLADVGSAVLRRLRWTDQLGRAVSGKDIIQNFLEKDKRGIDAVLVVSATRRSDTGWPSSRVSWELTLLKKSTSTMDGEWVEVLAKTLPPPRYEGYQARHLHLQAAFEPSAKGHYAGMSIVMTTNSTTFRISARALQELLAGRISLEQFFAVLGMGTEDGRPNFFEDALRSGQTLRSARLNLRGIDADDDQLELEFQFDPAAAHLE